VAIECRHDKSKSRQERWVSYAIKIARASSPDFYLRPGDATKQ
jgi:hypothetical protein